MSETTGLKTTFKWDNTTVASVASITPPGPQRETVEVDDLAPTDDIKKKLKGLIDVGECTFTLNFSKTATGHSTLEAALWSGAEKTCVITLPSGAGICTFPGFVSGWVPQEISSNNVVQVEVTITVTGKPVWT